MGHKSSLRRQGEPLVMEQQLGTMESSAAIIIKQPFHPNRRKSKALSFSLATVWLATTRTFSNIFSGCVSDVWLSGEFSFKS